MYEVTETLNLILAVGGVAAIFGAVILLIDLHTSRSLKDSVERFGLLTAFAVTLLGTVLTLVYSEILGFVPCGLCWLQRVFLYPQPFILGIALYTKDRSAALYGFALSIPGMLIALYQHYLQMGGSEFIDCPAAGGDCAQRILFEFGFMTFPLASASLFLFLAALYFYLLKVR